MEKISFFISFVFISCAVCAFFVLVVFANSEIISVDFVPTFLKPKEISLIMVGDIMLDRGVEMKIKNKGKGDYLFPFLSVVEEFKKADIVYGNLETPLSERGTKVGSIYSFRIPTKAAKSLALAGFSVLSFANNHVFDYGRLAFEDTISALKENNIDYVGAGFSETEAFSWKIKEIAGVKVGFLAFTDMGSLSWRARGNNSGIAFITSEELEYVKSLILKAKKEADILIVFLHSGIEYSQEISSFQKEFSHDCIDAGADLIVGHHPHVVQKSEEYRGKQIFYSLGNFVFDQDFSKETMQGLLLKVLISKKEKKIREIIQEKIEISSDFQPKKFFDEERKK